MAIDNPLGEELEQAGKIYNTLLDFFVNYSMQVVGAIIILVIGYFVAKAISTWLMNFLRRKDIDVTLSELLGSITYFAVLFCFVVISLGKFGISITPFIAALGAFTLGAGLAVQGVVGNYGAGFSIIFTRPFVVGNTLKVQGVSGIVEKIALPYTVLATEDGEKITIPNKEIIGQILENSFQSKLVETMISIDISADPRVVINALTESLRSLSFVSGEPAPQVGIDDFNDSCIRIGIRVWVPTATYFQSKYEVNMTIHDCIRTSNIRLRIPRQEVTLSGQPS